MPRTIRILITGSRDWPSRKAVWDALDECVRELDAHYGENNYHLIIVHGKARGADTHAAKWCQRRSIEAEEHPALWNLYGKKAGVIRNKEMVDKGANLCLAFPLPDSIGTIDCITRANKAGIPIRVVDATGTRRDDR